MNKLETMPAAATSAISPAPEPRPLKILRGAALIALVLVLAFLFGLWLLSRPGMLPVADAISDLAGRSRPDPDTGGRTAAFYAIILLILMPIVLLVLAARLRLRSWWWIGGGWLAAIPVLAYLAADEPSRRTIKLEEMAPAFPGAEASYAVLMRYGKNHPNPEALALEKLNHKFDWYYHSTSNAANNEAFVKMIEGKRAAIEADWAMLEPQRRWLDELNAFDRIGDLGTASPDADIIRFHVWRKLCQHSVAIAGLRAIDGRGDEAIATLLPVLEVARKLEPSARTLVRIIISRVIQRMTIEVAQFTLERTSVSPALRARLANALRTGAGGEVGARRLVAIDFAVTAGWLADQKSLGNVIHWDVQNGQGKIGWSGQLLNFIGPFVYNPQRTMNQYGDLIAELQELAARREHGKFDLRTDEFWRNEGRPRFKNFAGASIGRMSTPALGLVTENYWKVEARRLALLAQLEKS